MSTNHPAIRARLGEIRDTDLNRARALLAREAETAAEAMRRVASAETGEECDDQLATLAILSDMIGAVRAKL